MLNTLNVIVHAPFLSSCRNLLAIVTFLNSGTVIVNSVLMSKFNSAGSFFAANEPANSYLFSFSVLNARRGLITTRDSACSTVHKAFVMNILLDGAVTANSIPLVPMKSSNGEANKASSLYPYFNEISVRSPL